MLYSTHVLAEVGQIAGQVVIVRGGRLVCQGTPAEVAGGYGSLEQAFLALTGEQGAD